jgi:hypothetical protein
MKEMMEKQIDEGIKKRSNFVVLYFSRSYIHREWVK